MVVLECLALLLAACVGFLIGAAFTFLFVKLVMVLFAWGDRLLETKR